MKINIITNKSIKREINKETTFNAKTIFLYRRPKDAASALKKHS